MAPTIFIAVQCFQCSTMQVKQKKKSSNKWSCAVCNQKQSVTKVFAQGFMAKDIRAFVQSFNMSRKSLDEQSLFSGALSPALDEQIINRDDDKFNLSMNQRNKRSDWTEYLDPEDNHIQGRQETEQDGDGFEVKVVTELERSMFKKPRLQNYSPGLAGEDSDKLCKPRFPRRNANKKIVSQEERVKGENNYKEPDDQRSQKCQPTISKATSKWKDYMTEEDDSLQLGWKRASRDHADQGNNSVLEAMTNEETVDEDIHPDFM
ncbi:MRN complex-interacting protein-like [Neltuma alba]|uniref:MRN complex-interacting protein n=1 Tax=Neltuma alba TaxID=207710 RepID=UPI0010A4E6A9|nr:MRN complex-interacting protein [Prosopis alba]XP_028767342.1 MRN complex-interacting protein-like [Prosopis alba]